MSNEMVVKIGGQMVLEGLQKLQDALTKACSEETSSDSEFWTVENALWGHGDVIALVVQELLGGELLRFDVSDSLISVWRRLRDHHKNHLPCGLVLDFSAWQFGTNP